MLGWLAAGAAQFSLPMLTLCVGFAAGLVVASR
jgi:hypothetical protein